MRGQIGLYLYQPRYLVCRVYVISRSCILYRQPGRYYLSRERVPKSRREECRGSCLEEGL